jgi:hypothetical protein
VWLLKNAASAEEAVISSDMICHGGLVASRSAAVSRETAMRRLEIFHRIRRPGLRIGVFATIPRLHLHTSERGAPYEQALQRWSASGGETVLDGVPPDIIEEFLAVRRRNMDVLVALIGLARQGVIDGLVIGQDDASARGLNMKEQQALLEEIGRRGAGKKVMLLSGADELAMNMVTGWLCRHYGFHPRIVVEYDNPDAAALVPPLESHPLEKTVAQHLALSGAVQTPERKSADAVLFIATPEMSEEEREEAGPLISGLLTVMTAGTPAGLADMRYLNQADPALSEELIRRAPLSRLDAYAGWNTPSNTLGTAVAQVVAHRLAWRNGGNWPLSTMLESEKTHQAFLLARLVDDYWYQAVLREEVRPAADRLPPDLDPLLNLLGPVSVKVREQIMPWGVKLFNEHFRGKHIPLPLRGKYAVPTGLELRAVLPWQRVFEVEVRADMKLELREK